MKYLHIMKNEKFIAPFISFIQEHFDINEHHFIILGGISQEKHPIKKHDSITILPSKLTKKYNYFSLKHTLTPYFDNADKVIIHSFLIRQIIDFLFYNSKYTQKSYWIIWGGDLYDYEDKKDKLSKKFFFYKKKKVVSNLKGLITYVQGDYERAQKWFGAQGAYYPCLIYPSNLYKEIALPSKTDSRCFIQVGNSASSSNKHKEILEKLIAYKDENIKIFAPLSYGGRHGDKISAMGKKYFADKFEGLQEFLDFDTYMQLLCNTDIAIFNHKRQQAMGNIISLLGFGKKVYIRSDIATHELFESLHVKVFDSCGDISLEPLSTEDQENNRQRIAEYFSKDNLIKSWKTIFEEE